MKFLVTSRIWIFIFLLALFIDSAKCKSLHSRSVNLRDDVLSFTKNSALIICADNKETPLVPAGQHVAIFLSYIVFGASIALYLPIILDLVRAKNADYLSMETWVMSFASFSLALIYPLKKKNALISYIELLALHIQSYIILGIVCAYKQKMREFLCFSSVFALVVFGIFSTHIPPSILSIIQLLRLALDGYSLVPQITKNFSNQLFSYNELTAVMSATGNGMRIFTTLQLVKDPLVLSGYIIGLVSNLILLLQFFLYKKV